MSLISVTKLRIQSAHKATKFKTKTGLSAPAERIEDGKEITDDDVGIERLCNVTNR